MKFLITLFYFILNLLFLGHYAYAASIDGTSTIKYLTANQVFYNNQYAKGFVKLKAGATILGNATAFFKLEDLFYGGLDLRSTGTLNLQGDFYLDSSFTLSGSGIISGNGNSIFLNGNLTIPDNSIIHINTNTIIDGQGKDLVFGKRSKLFVDTNVTLTLQNMRIVQTFNDFSDPCIRLAAFKSQLALSNVELALSQNFLFPQGQLFIHDDVAFSGTCALVYRTIKPLMITSGAKLFFDIGTTFSVAPATFTDCPYSVKSTYTTNNFIWMADQTSQLYLNGCSFFTTLTGCRLRTGSLFFDNKVTMNSNAASAINATVPMVSLGSVGTGSAPESVSWSPDGRFLAVVNYSGNTLQIFSFSGSGNPILIGSVGTGGGSTPDSVSWSPDGRFLAVVNDSGSTLQIFSFNGSGNPTLIGSIGTASEPTSVSWSPDGRFLAVANFGNNTLQIFSFSGSGNPILIGSVGTGTNPYSVSWSPDGRFLAVVNLNGNSLQIFSFSGSGNPTLIGSVGTGTNPYSVSWSPDGRFLAVVNLNGNSLQIFSFSGSGNPTLIGSVGTGRGPYSVTWSPDGRFLAVVNSSGNTLQIFSFSGLGNPTLIGSIGTGTNPYSVSWSPDGRFLAVVNYSGPSLQVFGVNYVVDRSTQALSNSIVFGNSALGSSYDLNVRVLAGSNILINGLVNYDCVI